MQRTIDKSGELAVTLLHLRETLDPFHRKLINEFWQCFIETGDWPSTRQIHSRHKKSKILDSFESRGGGIFYKVEDYSRGHRYALSMAGVMLSDQGERYENLMIQYLEYLRTLYQLEPNKTIITSVEISASLKLDADETILLGKLVSISGLLGGGGGFGQSTWTASCPEYVEDLQVEGSLKAQFEWFVLRSFKENSPVFPLDTPPTAQRGLTTGIHWAGEILEQDDLRIDALKRRYQVFVSSTFDDLKEERQHVMQALLETKCIPTGMELFPAASTEQWELIKRVIDECDYYIIIIAGRYGSISDSGLSYTEKEFDYAVAIGKPVIGFYHKFPDTLPGSKLEKDDVGKAKLATFIEKVKRRLCRGWSTAPELGSSVKSAIINELEFNLKPGWVRADSVPTSDVVEKLKQRIADLEEQVKPKLPPASNFPSGREVLSIPVVVLFDFEEVEEDSFGSKIRVKKAQQIFKGRVERTWDELFLTSADLLQINSEVPYLRRRLEESFLGELRPLVEKEQNRKLEDLHCGVPREFFDRVIHTFIARQLLRFAPSDSPLEEDLLVFTAVGTQTISELKAFRNIG